MHARAFGPLLRQWRAARRMSQERLAADAEVSTRHIDLNAAALRVFAHFLPAPLDPRVTGNVMHALFHPDGLRNSVVNWEPVAEHLLARLRREALLGPEPEGPLALWEELRGYPGVPRAPDSGAPGASLDPWLPVHLKRDDVELRLFTTLATLGTPVDVAAEELRIETYFPADAATDAWLRASE